MPPSCYETRRPGVWCLTFDMTDYQELRHRAQIHARAKEAEPLRERHRSPGCGCGCRGSMELTRDGKDIQLEPYNIMTVPHEGRKDTAPEKRVELHLHTQNVQHGRPDGHGRRH